LLSLNSEGRSVLPLTKIHSSREPKQKDTQSNFSQKRHFDLRDERLKIKAVYKSDYGRIEVVKIPGLREAFSGKKTAKITFEEFEKHDGRSPRRVN
jgi:hypothetical protein